MIKDIRIFSILDPYLHWTNIRSIGNSTPAKLTIFIPLLGYLIIFNEYATQYFELSKELFFNHIKTSPGSDISTRLLSIYFGLCVIAFASLMYGLFCPREIKRHGSAEEFIGGDAQNLSSVQLRALARQLEGQDRREKDFIDFTIQLQKVSGSPAANYRQAHEETEVEGTRLYFEMKNRCWPAARWTCAGFYAAGLTILAIPSLEIFLRATALLIRKLI